MTFPCAAEAAERAYQRSLDRGDRHADAIERETERLMAPGEDCDPFAVEHLAEALAELPAVDLMRMSREFAGGCIATGGGATYYAVRNYWQRRARQQADENVTRGCQACFGEGCAACTDDFHNDHREH